MNKAQGALEYLLLLGGAILVVAIAAMVLLNTSGTGITTTNTSYSAFEVKMSELEEMKEASQYSGLAQNGGVEVASADPTIPEGWYKVNWGGDNSQISWDNTVSRNGTHSLKVINDGTGSNWWFTKDIQLKPTTQYRLVYHAKGSTTGTRADMYWAVSSNAGCGLPKLVEGDIFANQQMSDWTRFQYEIQAPDNATQYLCMWIGIPNGGTGTAWFDDIEVYEMQTFPKLVSNPSFEDDTVVNTGCSSNVTQGSTNLWHMEYTNYTGCIVNNSDAIHSGNYAIKLAYRAGNGPFPCKTQSAPNACSANLALEKGIYLIKVYFKYASGDQISVGRFGIGGFPNATPRTAGDIELLEKSEGECYEWSGYELSCVSNPITASRGWIEYWVKVKLNVPNGHIFLTSAYGDDILDVHGAPEWIYADDFQIYKIG